MDLAEQPHICRHQFGLLCLGESQIKAVINRMVELTGDRDGLPPQSRRAHQIVEEPWQSGGDCVNLGLADPAEPCRAPRRIAHLSNQKIWGDQSRSTLHDRERLTGVKLLRKKPFQRDARVDD